MTPGGPAVRYYVTVRGHERVVEIGESPDGLTLTLDGTPVTADLLRLHGSGLHSLLLDGHSREMILERDGDVVRVLLDGERIDARVQDEVSRALSAIGGAAVSGPAEIVAPMPGVIVDVPVAVGDEIAAGQPLVVVEAMKMQNELTAEADGIVEKILVKAGDTVAGDQALIVLKAKDEASG
jgi:biotin carboxyl carrier protein